MELDALCRSICSPASVKTFTLVLHQTTRRHHHAAPSSSDTSIRIIPNPRIEQALIVAAVFAALGAGTVATLEGVSDPARRRCRPAGTRCGGCDLGTSAWSGIFGRRSRPLRALGVVLQHLPGPRRAWAVWYLPGTSSFHVKWTGIAEQAGGVGLALGRLGVGADFGLEKESVAGLSALELGVAPANMYMFSQGTPFPKGLEVPVGAHAVRGFLQCALPAFVWILASA